VRYRSPRAQLSLFRRPLPTTNLRFASSVNWDGRNTPDPVEVPLITGLKNQANGATTGHAQGLALADGTRLDIANTELTFHTAQQKNTTAGALDAAGATGGAAALLTEPFTRGATRPGSTFNLFDAWTSAPGGGQNADRRRVAAGQAVFNTKTFAGTRTCSGCHSTPNIGTSAAFAFFDVGVSAASRRRPDDQILFKFERLAAKVTNPADAVGTGEMIETTDPGRALITGNWADMNKFKAPSLRGLAARAPYFHDGSVSSVAAVVDHYENHFGIEFTGSEKSDLIMFLESL
jgi:cytochrome c peroxidase